MSIIRSALIGAGILGTGCITTPVREASPMDVYVLRLQPGDDLQQRLTSFAREQGLRAAFIVSCVGSLKKAALRLSNRDEVSSFERTFEITSLVGTLAADSSHLHLSLADSQGDMVGGHVAPGNIIYTTAEVVIGEARALTFRRERDPASGWNELVVTPR